MLCWFVSGTVLLGYFPGKHTCSCPWAGPFLTVSRYAPLVVHAVVINHRDGRSPAMEVHVYETLKGEALDEITVQMGDGMHCRPTLAEFPQGSEWILALNGPGSKPGTGFALSHCGEYWLRVMGGEVIGSIDGERSQVKHVTLEDFKKRFMYPHFSERFSGMVARGERYTRTFHPRFDFILEPMEHGWEIVVREQGREENLARLTPPFHFVPNPRFIEGWHFSGNDSTATSCSDVAETGPPSNPRVFFFSPDVGARIDGPDAEQSVSWENVEEVKRFGQGRVTVEAYELERTAGGCPRMTWMKFSVELEGGY
ncbi:MAG: hypothetical protein QHI48_07980 [Bacteroidota bacterium]|nr:hypothetical protein [Bacteroidota bacterium]